MCAAQDGDVLAETGTGSWIKITGTVALVVIVLDRLTKWWIESNLEPGSCERSADACIDLVGSLRLHFIENPGMAFSQGEGVGRWLGVVAIILSAVLIRLATKTTSPWRLALLGLIIGGAIGNLIDRISRAENGFLSGSVVDFVDVQWFPIWNIADAAITCGVIGLLLLGNRDQPAEATEPSASRQTDHEPA